MHGNHQNWKGNKGVPEGAPLSLHGGCLATPASRSLPTPQSLLTPSALIPSQPFPPNRPAHPVPLSGIHFTFFSSPPSPSAHPFAYPYSGIPMLSFSLLPPPLAPLGPALTLLSSVCFLCHSLFRLAMYLRRNLRVFFSSRKLCFLVPLTHLQRGCILFLSERRSLSAPFRSSLLHLIPPFPHLLASEELLSFSFLLSPPSLTLFSLSPGEYIATAPEAVARILSTRGTLRHATPRHSTPRYATLYSTINREKERQGGRCKSSASFNHPLEDSKDCGYARTCCGPRNSPETSSGRATRGWKN